MCLVRFMKIDFVMHDAVRVHYHAVSGYAMQIVDSLFKYMKGSKKCINCGSSSVEDSNILTIMSNVFHHVNCRICYSTTATCSICGIAGCINGDGVKYSGLWKINHYRLHCGVTINKKYMRQLSDTELLYAEWSSSFTRLHYTYSDLNIFDNRDLLHSRYVFHLLCIYPQLIFLFSDTNWKFNMEDDIKILSCECINCGKVYDCIPDKETVALHICKCVSEIEIEYMNQMSVTPDTQQIENILPSQPRLTAEKISQTLNESWIITQ